MKNQTDTQDKSHKKKAIALLSGGLDSALATKLIKEMGFEIIALNFQTAFCTCSKKGCKSEARKVANEFDIPLKVMSVTKEYMQIVRNPKYGYGSGMNPCIDCRMFMFKKAKAFMEEVGASFVITGEVLGQRPMSQTRKAMKMIEQKSGLEGFILRPLTTPSVKGCSKGMLEEIDFDKLPDITGRSRKKQLALAKELNIENYICGSGGCLLTEKEFSNRLRDYFKHNIKDNIDQIKLLKVGRHFRLDDKVKLLVGRDEHENKKLSFYKYAGIYLEPEEKGPSGLVLGDEINSSHLQLAGKIIGRYCQVGMTLSSSERQQGDRKLEGEEIHLNYTQNKESKTLIVKPFKPEDLTPFWIL